ncbi:MAG: FAD-dependent monooxygenase, partial [Rhodoferax sp.]|nr:FAD-dependent monooxygenase [Rhodoferax sp.]
FAGDVAHQVSPFGARGANSGIQDTDNLCWKLKLVIDGKAPARLLDTYSEERTFAADENLMNSTRSTDFITPKSKTSLTFRNAVLSLAREHKFARALVNSGRLSVPAYLTESRLNTPDTDTFEGDMVPGAPMDDAPMQLAGREVWLLDQVGNRFMALVCVESPTDVSADQLAAFIALGAAAVPVEVVLIAAKPGPAPQGVSVLVDRAGRFAERFDARSGTTYLIRPDQHVAARWRGFDAGRVQAALARATCNVQ